MSQCHHIFQLRAAYGFTISQFQLKVADHMSFYQQYGSTIGYQQSNYMFN